MPPASRVLRLTTMSLIMAASPRWTANNIASLCHARCRSLLRQIKASAPRLRLLLLDAAVGVELADIGPQIGDLLLVLDAGEDHLGAGHLGPRILDVVLEFRLVPDDAGILVGVGIGEIGDAAGMPAVDAVELGADLVLRVIADRMARQAFVERNLALGGVLCRCRTG